MSPPPLTTLVSSRTQTVAIGQTRPVALIGERINPSGRKRLMETLRRGDMSVVRRDALAQTRAGAALLDVNVGVPGLDQAALMQQVIQALCEVTDAPLCIDSHKPRVLEAALDRYQGKALLNSVSARRRSLAAVLPLARERGAAVIGLAMDDEGLPQTAEERLRAAAKIVERAESIGLSREDVIVDPLVLAARTDAQAAQQTLKSIRLIVHTLGVNVTLGASNLSHGLPRRSAINAAFLSMAIAAGVTCPIANPLDPAVRQAILASSLILGRGDWETDWPKRFPCQDQPESPTS